ncbi:MAG: nucleotidyltransferase [Bacilli bacterium]|nr:nucleotidyltransferase [Bacilli bacterium]
MDLLILAAGMGSRFGGLKQVEPFDARGNFIIDYSIFDAKRAGFDRVVFLIKEETREIFESTVGSRVAPFIEVVYAYQKLDVLPEGYSLPKERVKPLGTAQAIYCAKDVLKGPFAIINSDDFYGADAFRVAADYLRSLPEDAKGKYANIAYFAKNTMTRNGSVKRGILEFDAEKNLTSLVESKLEWRKEDIYAAPLESGDMKKVDLDTLVSMNMFAFSHDILDKIGENFPAFLDANQDGLLTCEYLIPTLVDELIAKGEASCKVLSTTAKWHGVTYREDKDEVVSSLQALVDAGEYPSERFGSGK